VEPIMAGGARKLLTELRRYASGALPEYLIRQRWFGGKARAIRSVRLMDVVPMIADRAFVVFAEVRYADGPKETYVLPLLRVSGDASTGLGGALHLGGDGTEPSVVLHDALQDEECLQALMHVLEEERRMPGAHGEIRAERSSMFAALHGLAAIDLATAPLRAEQSNTSIRYGDRLILKCFRRLQEGINPDLEIGLFLTEKAHFPHVPAVAGSLEYTTGNGRTMTLGILQAYVANQGTIWDEALRCAADSYNRMERVAYGAARLAQSGTRRLLHLAEKSLPPEAAALAGSFLHTARLLGERTAQLHVALASAPSDDPLAPEPFTPAFRRKLGAAMREGIAEALRLLRRKQQVVPERWRAAVERVANAEQLFVRRTRAALRQTSSAMRTRIHGDYHLGQVLRAGSDLVIIDFEGEPARTIQERRVKRSPLQDVAGMLRSFHYAAFVPLLGPSAAHSSVRDAEASAVWADCWWEWMAGCFLRAYLETSGSSCHIPGDRNELAGLLEFHLLEKAIYEPAYELNNRPEWVGIPLVGICSILESE
jgi:trehalose synthase-fused probable maltokinase